MSLLLLLRGNNPALVKNLGWHEPFAWGETVDGDRLPGRISLADPQRARLLWSPVGGAPGPVSLRQVVVAGLNAVFTLPVEEIAWPVRGGLVLPPPAQGLTEVHHRASVRAPAELRALTPVGAWTLDLGAAGRWRVIDASAGGLGAERMGAVGAVSVGARLEGQLIEDGVAWLSLVVRVVAQVGGRLHLAVEAPTGPAAAMWWAFVDAWVHPLTVVGPSYATQAWEAAQRFRERWGESEPVGPAGQTVDLSPQVDDGFLDRVKDAFVRAAVLQQGPTPMNQTVVLRAGTRGVASIGLFRFAPASAWLHQLVVAEEVAAGGLEGLSDRLGELAAPRLARREIQRHVVDLALRSGWAERLAGLASWQEPNNAILFRDFCQQHADSGRASLIEVFVQEIRVGQRGAAADQARREGGGWSGASPDGGLQFEALASLDALPVRPWEGGDAVAGRDLLYQAALGIDGDGRIDPLGADAARWGLVRARQLWLIRAGGEPVLVVMADASPAGVNLAAIFDRVMMWRYAGASEKALARAELLALDLCSQWYNTLPDRADRTWFSWVAEPAGAPGAPAPIHREWNAAAGRDEVAIASHVRSVRRRCWVGRLPSLVGFGPAPRFHRDVGMGFLFAVEGSLMRSFLEHVWTVHPLRRRSADGIVPAP